MNTRIYGEHDRKTIDQLNRCMEVGSAVKGVLCADGHLGYAHPIGGVVAYEEHISISGVGFDIACGNMAVRLDTRYEDITAQAGRILSDIGRSVSFGIGQKNAVRVDHELFDSPLWDEAGARDLKTLAAQQLGTVGSGNHYVDLFEDQDGLVWIGVHFGSRGLGHKITTRHLALAPLVGLIASVTAAAITYIVAVLIAPGLVLGEHGMRMRDTLRAYLTARLRPARVGRTA